MPNSTVTNSTMPSGAIFGNYEEYTDEDWGQQAPQLGCDCGYCAAYGQYHPGWHATAGAVPFSMPLPTQGAGGISGLSLDEYANQIQSNVSFQISPSPILEQVEIMSKPIPKKKKLLEGDSLVQGGIKIKSSLEVVRELSETKVLYLIRGVNGSGKTTLAYLISLAFRKGLSISSSVQEVDDFFRRDNVEGETVYYFELDKLPNAHARCQDKVREAMNPSEKSIGGQTRIVIVSNPFTSRQHLLPYQRLAREFGYKVVEIICKSSFENLHGVPPDKVRKMRQEFEN